MQKFAFIKDFPRASEFPGMPKTYGPSSFFLCNSSSEYSGLAEKEPPRNHESRFYGEPREPFLR